MVKGLTLTDMLAGWLTECVFLQGFPADFSELGVMRGGLEESSSSDSPTQEMTGWSDTLNPT